MLSPQARYRDYLSTAHVHRLVKRHDDGEADLGLPLWTLLSFEIWLRSFPGWVNQQPAAAAAARA